MSDINNAQVIQDWSAVPYEFLDNFGDEGDFARQHLLNPAIFAFLGSVQDKSILDAGSGQGYLSRLLARKGARVTAIEPGENLYRYALEREQIEKLGITYIQQDLSSLTDLTETFDVVVSNMVFMDIADYEAAMRDCIARLKTHGSFIFSLVHPCFEESSLEWVRKGYVEVREYFQEYARRTTFGYTFHRPLSAYLNLVIREGCMLRAITEPKLAEELASQDKNHERALHVPNFIVVHAIRADTP